MGRNWYSVAALKLIFAMHIYNNILITVTSFTEHISAG